MKHLSKTLLILLFIFSIITVLCNAETYYYEDEDVSFNVNGVHLPVNGYEPGKPWDNCWTFASIIYNKIWGTESGNDLLRKVDDDEDLAITEVNTKKYILAAKEGAHIRLEDRKGQNEHSMILVEKDRNGFTVYHGNMNKAIYFTYYTYYDFAEHFSDYKYFEFIAWPGAPAYEKAQQNINVSNITPKTYGDEEFQVLVIPDSVSGLTNIQYNSDNTNVAEISKEGLVKIKNAGTANISVTESGDAYYAKFVSTQKLVINKANISISADDTGKKIGNDDPALTYTITSGKLYGTDSFTGSLERRAGERIGTYKITQGSLKLNDNYNLSFTPGTFTILEKTPQNIKVSDITEKTYGDAPFKLEVTPDSESKLSDFTYESSNTNVAQISEDGTVTITGAGTANITVKQAGDSDYAAFTKTQKLNVSKVNLTVTADDKVKRINTDDPELTYTFTGTLVGDDTFTGGLTRKPGERLGKYDILQGTLKVSDSYNITYNKGSFEIVEKTPQNITVAPFEEKTYGDAPLKIEATPDSESKLSNFTYESDNTEVAEVSEDGTVTITGAGTANITVKQAGNEDYAAFSKTQQLVVNKKSVSIREIDLDKKTAIIEGLLDKDADITVDFNKLRFEDVTKTDETTSSVNVANLEFVGDGALNYAASENSIKASIKTESIAAITITSENGTVTGGGKAIKGSTVSLTAAPNTGYTFGGWYQDSAVVSKETTYTIELTDDIALTAQFNKKPSGGGGGGGSAASYTVRFETNGGSDIAKISADRNSKISEPSEPTKSGYDFDGWYTDKELTKQYDFNTSVTKSFTLYAKWTEEETKDNRIILTIDKKEAQVFGKTETNDVAPIIVNDRTMLPARFVAENLGANVEWNGNERKVRITNADTEIILYIDSDTAYVDGIPVTLDSPAFIRNDRTYTPVRFIAETLGSKVEWSEGDRQVIITKQ